MISNIIDTAKKITSQVLIIFVGITSLANAEALDHSLHSNRNFLISTGANGTLSIPKIKNSKHPVANLSNSTGSLELSKLELGIQIKYTRDVDKFRYEMYIKDSRVGLLVTTLEKEFNDTSCPPSLRDPINRLMKSDISDEIQKIAFSSDFFAESCGEVRGIRRKKISSFIAKEINPKTSYIMKCFGSEEAGKYLAKNPRFAAMANQVAATYINDFDQIEKNQSKLKLECVPDEKASYEPQSQTINLPFLGGALKVDPCKGDDQIFAHELFHRSGLNEEDTKYLDSVCGNILKVEGTKNRACTEVYDLKLKTEGHQAVVAIKKSQQHEVKKQQEVIVEALKQDVNVAEFVPVQDADIKEITNPTSGGAYQASVDRVYNTMSSNMEKMAAPLNRAIASTVTTARAERTKSTTTSERSISKTTIAGLRQPASANSNGNEEYVVEEILADKYNVPVSEVRAASVAAGVAAPGSATSQTVATRSAARTLANTTAPAGGNEIAGSNAGPGGGQVATASTGGSSAGGGVPGRSVSGGARGNSRLPASAGGNTVGSDPLVEQLGQFNEVRGQRYRQLTERYDDPSFEPELKAKNIAIEYRRNNKTTIIGETSNSRTLFRDDGTVLKKISGAK